MHTSACVCIKYSKRMHKKLDVSKYPGNVSLERKNLVWERFFFFFFGFKQQKFILASHTRSLKTRCQQGCTFSESSKGESFITICGFGWPQMLLGLWQHHFTLCLRFHMAFSHFCVSMCPLLLFFFLLSFICYFYF